MTLADRQMLIGAGMMALIFGLALWSLGGKRPHTKWLESLKGKPMGFRKRTAVLVVVFLGVLTVVIIAVAALTGPLQLSR